MSDWSAASISNYSHKRYALAGFERWGKRSVYELAFYREAPLLCQKTMATKWKSKWPLTNLQNFQKDLKKTCLKKVPNAERGSGGCEKKCWGYSPDEKAAVQFSGLITWDWKTCVIKVKKIACKSLKKAVVSIRGLRFDLCPFWKKKQKNNLYWNSTTRTIRKNEDRERIFGQFSSEK